MVALLSIVSVRQANAYTVSDLTSDGWTKITTISQSDITDKYYVFVANDADLMLGLATSSNQSSTAAFYQAVANPALDAKKVWTLEANGENYGMRNLYSNSRQMQTEWSGTDNDLRWRTNDQTGSISWTGLGLAYSDDAWSLTSTQYNRPLGIYNNETGTPVEGKEIGANDAGKGQKFQIYAISRDAYWALAASSATIANPANFTGKISNQEIYNGDKVKMPRGWTENTAIRSAGNSNRTAGTGVTVLEGWTGSAEENSLKVDYYQNLTSLPVGVYTLTANGGDSNGTGGGKIYISSGGSEESVSLGTADADVETKKIASDGTLTIGLRANGKNSWVHANNFRLKYFGQTIEQAAIDIPAGGSITAGQWYKYSVSVTGNYTITAGSTTGFIQTTEGDQMVEDASGDAIETGAEVALTAGTTIYYNSSSDNTLTIEANIKTYNVGAVTSQSIANGSYINNLTTLVLTYGDAATNDGDASLEVIGSAKASLIKGALEIATGTLTADDAAKTLTATFAGVELVNGATDYSIVIPAGAFGYEGQSVNTEKVVAFNTGIIADGLYYFQKKGTQKYLGRGGSYGTEAVVADLGISFELAVQADGSYTFKNHDQSLAAAAAKYLNYNDGNGGNYTDQTAYGYTLEATEGGYYMRPDATYYMTSTTYSTDLDVPYDYFNRTTTVGEAIVWVPINKETYNSNIAALRDAEAAAVATSAGFSATTLAALKTALASNYVIKDVTSSISNAACRANLNNWTQVKYAANGQKDFDANGTCGEVWSGLGGIKQSITGLKEGIYKVSVHATWRPGGKDSGNNAGNEINTNAWVYANTATSENLTQLKSWYSGGASIDNRAAMVASGDTYLNDVYVYVSEDEELTIGLASPTMCNGAWLPFFDWTLTYYDPNVEVAISEAGYATFNSDYALDLDNISGGTAYIIKADAVSGEDIVITPQAGKIAANTGLILKAEGGAEGTITIPVAASGDAVAANKLVAVTADATPIAVGDYVLGAATDNSNVGLYKLATTLNLNKGQAYLPGDFASSSVKVLNFVIEGETPTGVDAPAVAEAEEDGVLYNTAGQVVTTDYKGIVIKNGKKYYQK